MESIAIDSVFSRIQTEYRYLPAITRKSLYTIRFVFFESWGEYKTGNDAVDQNQGCHAGSILHVLSGLDAADISVKTFDSAFSNIARSIEYNNQINY